MPPGLVLGVVHLATLRRALRACERGAPLEVDAQLKPTLIGIEGGLHDTPRRHEPERLLKEIDIAHPRILADHRAPLNRPYPLETARRQLTGIRALEHSIHHREQPMFAGTTTTTLAARLSHVLQALGARSGA